MLNFLKLALAHWKTSTAGVAAALLFVAMQYKAGMTWQQWGLAVVVALGGMAASDGK